VREVELRKYANCSLCGKPIGHTRLPVFARVTVERIGILIEPLQRAAGLTALLGGSARLAHIMGTDEEMTQSIGGVVTLSVCEACYIRQISVAELAEHQDVLAEKSHAGN
jgi:hypothetical protein